MIASFGGAEVSKDGTRNYSGSGGLVGGLSFKGGNWAYFAGAGREYNRFTPNNAYPDDWGDTGGVIVPFETGGGIEQPPPVVTTGGGGSAGTPTPTVTPTPTPTFTAPSSPFRGLSGIVSGGNSLIGAINSVFSQYQSGSITQQQALLQAQLLSGYLNNPSYFYQAQRGDDASALVRFRMQANSIINSIRNWFAPTTSTDNKGGGKTQDCLGCGSEQNPTQIPMLLPQGILEILDQFLPSARTKVEAPPNLFSFTPTGASSTQGSNTTRNLAMLAVVAVVAYYLWKKYA